MGLGSCDGRFWVVGTWRFMVVVSRVISRLTTPITHIRGLIALLKTTPEPLSRVEGLGFGA